MKRTIFFIIAALAGIYSYACTNFLVGKKASTDGSTFITYNADDYGMYGRLIYLPHATHEEGEMRKIYDGDTHHYLGEIAEAPETYAVIGYMNEFQLAIMETTFGGREELTNPEGIIDYVSLMRLGLQRAKTAREAIKVMTDLVETYGYASGGESFSIADKDEVWILEMIGKGKGVKGTNWVAVRIPDDAIACHANHARIHKFSQYDKNDVLHSKDLIKFAREKGYFSGKDKEFDFSAAFDPENFSSLRYCDARAWSFFNRFVDGMDKYLDSVDGLHIGQAGVEQMPLYFKPKQLLSRQDVMDAMRDHYEGTPFDVQKDCGMGPGEMPYRPTPLEFEYEGKKYFNERPISTQQTADTYIAQIRGNMPDCIGGILWYGQDDPNMIAYVPVYCQITEVPDCFDPADADATHFSWNSAFWVCNWVSNMVYPRYNQLFPTLQTTRDELDKLFTKEQERIEAEALRIYEENPDTAKQMVDDFTTSSAILMHQTWKSLGERLIVEFNDMVVKPRDEEGYKLTEDGLPVRPIRPGYPNSYKKKIIEETGTSYLIPEKK